MDIIPIDMMSRLQDLDESIIRQSNRYYAEYGFAGTVENLTWISDRIALCEDSLRDKVREGLVGVLHLESGVPLVLFFMMNIIMDVNNSDPRFLTEKLQVLRMRMFREIW